MIRALIGRDRSSGNAVRSRNAWFLAQISPAQGYPSGGASHRGLFKATESTFSFAFVSFSSPERSDILCSTTDIRHDFFRGCCLAHGPRGLLMA